MGAPERLWNTRQANRTARIERVRSALGPALSGKQAPAGRIADLLHAALECGDSVCLEGNNQKQADFLGKALAGLDPARINGVHMLQSVLALPEHLDVFEKGIASKLDFPSPARRQDAWRGWCRPAASRSARFILISNCSAATSSICRRAWPWSPPMRPTGTAICIPARTPKTRRRLSRRPHSAAAS